MFLTKQERGGMTDAYFDLEHKSTQNMNLAETALLHCLSMVQLNWCTAGLFIVSIFLFL